MSDNDNELVLKSTYIPCYACRHYPGNGEPKLNCTDGIKWTSDTTMECSNFKPIDNKGEQR